MEGKKRDKDRSKKRGETEREMKEGDRRRNKKVCEEEGEGGRERRDDEMQIRDVKAKREKKDSFERRAGGERERELYCLKAWRLFKSIDITLKSKCFAKEGRLVVPNA